MVEMLKWIVPVTRKPEMEREQFNEFWRCIHAPHVANLAKPERYCITLFERTASLGGTPPAEEMAYDGMAELWFRDLDHFNEAFGEQRGGLRGIDGFGELIEPASDALLTTENVIVDGAVDSELVKWVAFVKMRTGVERGELFSAWSEGHSPRVAESIAKTDGACIRYTTSHANRGVDSTWDGIASLWYRDEAAAEAGIPPSERPGDPFPPLIDAAGTVILQGREITVVG